MAEEQRREVADEKHQARVDRLMQSSWYRWYALGILVLVYCSSHVDRQIMGILLEPIKMELGASDTQMGFLIGLTFAIFYATLGMPIAMLADRTNRRNIIALATTIWVCTTRHGAHWGGYWRGWFQSSLAFHDFRPISSGSAGYGHGHFCHGH